jgi:hypothetical protein
MTDKSSNIQSKEKPKICAINLDSDIVEALQAKGLNCFAGTLGFPVKVPNLNRGDRHPCLPGYIFPPNLHEYDIVIVDLQHQEPIEYIESEHTHRSWKGSEQTVLLSSYPETIFDPRPLSSRILRGKLKDFFDRQTLIIVFCSMNEVAEYHPTVINHNSSYKEDPIHSILYEFLPVFPENSNKTGNNVVVSSITEDIEIFLQKHIKNFIYEIVFQHPKKYLQNEKKSIEREDFVPLLLNYNNEIVGFTDFSLKGSIVFAFPQLQKGKKDFLLGLIDELLPTLFPTIFPYSDQFCWLKLDNYFVPNQSSLLARKEKLKDDYEDALNKIEGEIKSNQSKYQFLHNLITGTGDSLVKSIEYFLGYLDFKNIINMDETQRDIKEEDLQISLEQGLLVIEVKGIGGTSKDSECSQISKIKFRRAKERNKFDVFALYIVNHQRYLPPLERKNPPFSEKQIEDAQSDGRGLLTTYELFKLYFHIEEGFVTKEDARNSLLQCGLIQFKPSKSHLLGCPLEIHRKGEVVILNIDNITLKTTASIIVCNKDNWFRVEILEIRLNDQIVESISEGEVGVKLSRGVVKTSELWLEEMPLM